MMANMASALAWMVLVVLWTHAGAMAYEEKQDFTRGVSLEQRLGGQIPLDLAFTDESGRTATLGEFFGGKPIVLAMVYYECPQICTLVLDGVARGLRPLNLLAGEDYRVVAVSIDATETPEQAGRKKKSTMTLAGPEASVGWHLLTGEAAPITELAKAVGFHYRENEQSERDRFIHAAGILVVTPDGKISRYFYGFDYPPRDLRLALVEASGNRIGSAIDQLMLLCYRYDPAQGKYTLAILSILRLSGVMTILALGSFLFVQFRREHGKRRFLKFKEHR
jgi:protein SCO1